MGINNEANEWSYMGFLSTPSGTIFCYTLNIPFLVLEESIELKIFFGIFTLHNKSIKTQQKLTQFFKMGWRE